MHLALFFEMKMIVWGKRYSINQTANFFAFVDIKHFVTREDVIENSLH